MRRCFAPVLDKRTEIVFLGSFPGEESLKRRQYYAHPQNQFWKLVGKIVNEDLHSMGYDDKLKTLKKHGIGLWDVIGKCSREGSCDAKITDKRLNDFSKINSLAPNLKLVCFNGKTSGRFFNEISAPNKIILPSSSPANTTKLSLKLKEWRKSCAALSDS